jgi:hypothetical protein
MTILNQPTIMIGLGGKIQMVYHFIQFTFSGLLVGMWEESTLHLAPWMCEILIEAQMGSWCKGMLSRLRFLVMLSLSFICSFTQ